MIVVTCPHCGTEMNCHHNISDPTTNVPVDGDACLCAECGDCSVFDSTAPGGAREPSEAETTEIESLPGMALSRKYAALIKSLLHEDR